MDPLNPFNKPKKAKKQKGSSKKLERSARRRGINTMEQKIAERERKAAARRAK